LYRAFNEQNKKTTFKYIDMDKIEFHLRKKMSSSNLTYWELALIDELLQHHMEYHEEESTSDFQDDEGKIMHQTFLESTDKTRQKVLTLMDLAKAEEEKEFRNVFSTEHKNKK
tara:strand:- start:379 stop:717 length:339 start_codon:yes stop_codon:yes gene_type:complete